MTENDPGVGKCGLRVASNPELCKETQKGGGGGFCCGCSFENKTIKRSRSKRYRDK